MDVHAHVSVPPIANNQLLSMLATNSSEEDRRAIVHHNPARVCPALAKV